MIFLRVRLESLVLLLFPLFQAMSFLVNGIKAQAESEEDADLQKRLLAAAKNLADATAKMVEAAKVSFKIYLGVY